MASQVLMPSRAPTQLDALSTALQIGSTLYGIKYQGEKLEQEKLAAASAAETTGLQQSLLKEQIAEKKSEAATRERIAKGEFTSLEFAKFAKDNNLMETKNKDGIPVMVSGRQVYLSQKPDIDTQIKQASLQKAQIELANLPEKLKRDLENQKVDQQYKIAKTIEALNTQNTSEKKEFAKLPTENQEMIKDLAKKNVNLISIQNEIKTALKILTDPAVSEDQKIVQGKGLLKTLNSTQGADAIGAEESKRLGSFLEYKIANFRDPGSFIGRDLDKFIEQTALTADKLEGTISQNVDLIKQFRGKTDIQPNKLSEFKKLQMMKGQDLRGGLIQSAQAAPQTKVPTFNPNKPFNVLGK